MMGKGLFNKKNAGPPKSPEKRRSERHQTNMLSCHIGDVVDISSSGMKLKCAGKPPVKIGQVFEVKLDSGSQRLPVQAQVVWMRRSGLKGFTVGVRFVNVKKSLQAAVESLAMFGYIDLEAVAAKKKQKFGDPDKQREKYRQPIRALVDLPNYYNVLEVRHDASSSDIQSAFRLLARKYHPDVAKNPEDAAKFLQISAAYDILHDPAKRKSYDLRRAG